jgi:hypothetical protein
MLLQLIVHPAIGERVKEKGRLRQYTDSTFPCGIF